MYEKTTLRPVGSTNLFDINQIDGTAEFGILIGAKDCWNKGYGTETARLLLDYGFTVLGLRNIMRRTLSFNPRAIRADSRAGYREFGRRHNARTLAGQSYDMVYMECLSEDFRSPIIAKALFPDELNCSGS